MYVLTSSKKKFNPYAAVIWTVRHWQYIIVGSFLLFLAMWLMTLIDMFFLFAWFLFWPSLIIVVMSFMNWVDRDGPGRLMRELHRRADDFNRVED